MAESKRLEDLKQQKLAEKAMKEKGEAMLQAKKKAE